MKLKSWQVVLVLTVISTLAGWGSGGPKVVSLAVSPQTANARISPAGGVTFTATATFENNSSRQVSSSDGLRWATSTPSIATISSNGTATCVEAGTVTITATVPSNLKMSGNGPQRERYGSAQLHAAGVSRA